MFTDSTTAISNNTNSVMEIDSFSASKKIWKKTDILYETM